MPGAPLAALKKPSACLPLGALLAQARKHGHQYRADQQNDGAGEIQHAHIDRVGQPRSPIPTRKSTSRETKKTLLTRPRISRGVLRWTTSRRPMARRAH